LALNKVILYITAFITLVVNFKALIIDSRELL
jgi:hypothetical protein